VNQTAVRRGVIACAMGLALAATAAFAPPAQAGLLDGIFSSKTDLGSNTQREWRIDEFTWVKLVEAEAGAPGNQHPANVDSAALSAQLGAVRANTRDGVQPLFAEAELAELAPVLARALVLAKPGDDVLVLSTARRGGRLAAPVGITARLFVQGDALNLIVNDTRLAFLQEARNTRKQPKFVYGSRAKAGAASLLRGDQAASKRSDWVTIPVASLAAGAVPTAAAAVQPATVQPVAPAARPAPVTAGAPVTVVPAAPPVPGSAAAVGEEIEQRLTTLKRLRDKNLISEEEYQQKRREVLQKL